MRLILASSSPRRKELLNMLGFVPEIIVPFVDESSLPGEPMEVFLRRVSIAKGEAVYREEFFDVPVVSSDTIVWCDNLIIGKPVDRDEAYRFMKILSGNVHEVLTGVAVRYRGISYYEYARTRVEFSQISEEELAYYLDKEHYLDKAGAYAIQGLASAFIKRIEGC
ncbi:MAG: nucleoside triphosphate pyrophosphatase, partial [Acidobacteriota bacterium]|nr:nucleoside triphosphate pyrophosphatase [Acidobacteriota bacterium]